ncbi:MAG: NAD-binding protein [Firmicutes bacterium]|nr:NAD-binding protein [Bacillota bacterium]
MYIVIVGGGKVGYYLAKTLLSEKYEVTLLDWNFDKVKLLKHDLGEAVIYANGSSIGGLEKAGCARADVIVAVTGDDEDNLVICQLGKRYFKVPKAIARINNPKNERVFKELGVGTTISGTISIVEAIEQYLVKQQITRLMSFNHDEMALLETELPAGSPVTGKKISEVQLPRECLIIAVLRGKTALLAKGDLSLAAGDLVLAITAQHEQSALKKVLIGE